MIGAVAVLVGFAAYDALRSSGAGEPPVVPPRPATTDADAVTTDTVPKPLPRGVLGGALLYVDVGAEGSCGLRLVYLRNGEEARYPQDTMGCSLSAPPTGPAVAKSISDEPDETLRFRIIDPGHSDRPFRDVSAREGRLSWSLDGRRVLWCALGPRGYELELPRTIRDFRKCADGYTAGGERVYLRGRRLFVGNRLVLERRAAIDEAVWSANGSVGLVVGGRRLERWSEGRLDGAVVLPEGVAFSPTYFSRDNCAAVVLAATQVYLFDLGCFPARDSFPSSCGRRIARVLRCFPWFTPSSFFGHNANLAAWSPDGNWIAVIEADAIVFHHVVGQYSSVRWEVRAATLAWR